MTTPRFSARKVGDQYVFDRQDLPGVAGDVGLKIGGGLLTLAGLARGGVSGVLLALGGVGLMYRAFTGKNPLGLLCSQQRGLEAPSFQHEDASSIQPAQEPEDEVDESSMESFPASDPPARHSSTSTTNTM